MYRGGLAYMRHSISDTAEWGDYVAGPRIVTPEVKKAMRKLLDEIQDGSFAKKFIAENETGRKEFTRIRKQPRPPTPSRSSAPACAPPCPSSTPSRSSTAPCRRPGLTKSRAC
jgi:hypothetical protein